MANPAPIISQINAFNATEGTIISFNIVGGTSIVRSNIIYIYDLSDNSLICTHLYISTESIHELPANTDPSIVYASGKSSADFTNGKQYYAQIQTFTNTAGTEGASGASIAKLFWCLVDPTLTINTIPSSISTTSYNAGAVYNSNTTATSNIVQQYQFNLYSATGVLVQSSGVITGSGAQQGTSTAYDLSYNFTGLNVGSSYYVTAEVTTTQGMTVSAQSSTFTVSIDTPTLGEATVVNNACDGYISVTSNLSGEYGGSASGSIATFETTSVNEVSSLVVDMEPQQDLNGYDHPWVGGAGKNKYPIAIGKDSFGDNVNATHTSDNDVLTVNCTVSNDSGVYSKGASTLSTLIGAYSEPIAYSFDIRASASATISVGYQGYGQKNVDVTTSWQRVTFTTTGNGRGHSFVVYNKSASAVSVEVKDFMFELGSSASAFEPYSNLCPISGWDSVEAYVTGVNVWDEEWESGYYSRDNGNKAGNSNTTYFRSKNFIPCLPSTTYYIKQPAVHASNSTFCGLLFYDADQNYISARTESTSRTFTTPSNAYYMTFYIEVGASGATYQHDISINYPSTDHEYHAYNGHTHTATFDETVYGGTVDLVSGVLTVDRAYDQMTYEYLSGLSSSYIGFTANVTQVGGNAVWVRNWNYTDYPQNIDGGIKAVCNAFPISMQNKTIFSSQYRIYFGVGDMTSVEEFLTAVQTLESNGGGLWIAHELAEPRTIQLSPQTINTLVGVNNVWADSGEVSVTYNIPITNLLVKRQDTADISGKWLTLYSQPVTQASDMDFTFIDFLNQYGKTYKYALVPLLTQEQSGVEVEVEGGYTVSDEVVSIFDGVFVADNTAIYKLKAGVNYGDLSKVQEVGSINTIGSQYPIIVSNSKVDYRTASLSATIVADDYYNNGNLNRMDMVQKRELMESFFANKRAKILKDWNGNIWLVVFIDNINISFINEYGMGIAILTATWTEIGDVTSEEDLQNTRIINVG